VYRACPDVQIAAEGCVIDLGSLDAGVARLHKNRHACGLRHVLVYIVLAKLAEQVVREPFGALPRAGHQLLAANSLIEAALAVSAAATGMAGKNLSEMLLGVRSSGVSR
jgi:hypothetical protein